MVESPPATSDTGRQTRIELSETRDYLPILLLPPTAKRGSWKSIPAERSKMRRAEIIADILEVSRS